MGLISLWPYLLIAAVALFTGGYVTGCSEEKDRFDQFKAATKAVGDAQEERTRLIISNQKRSADESEKRSQRTIADIRRKFDGMRANPNSSNMPSVPDTTTVSDDKARDNRLLEVLRIAEEQTTKLTELQKWISDQK